MPLKYLNRNNNSSVISVGNSVLFNGSNQYLSIPGNAAFAFETGNFTIEWWQYMTSQPSNPRVFSIGNYPSTTIGVSIEGGTFYLWENSGIGFNYSLTAGGYLNRWLHFAISRNNGTTSIFKDGIQIGSSYSDTNNINNTSTALSIGQESSPSSNSYFPGYISNFRIVKGTALYTSNFTPPTSPLTAIANTSLLTCQSATIIDNSSNNFTITNNGAATVSSTAPFTTINIPSGVRFLNKSNVAILLPGTQKAIFGYGTSNVTNLVSNVGVVATDTTGVGTARYSLAAAGYGTDKAIFGYGYIYSDVDIYYAITNLVSNTGVVATDTTGVGTARYRLAATGYGTDKAIFGYGYNNSYRSITNLVSNTGVVATDTTGVGTARWSLAAAGYGSDKAIFGYGNNNNNLSMTNLVSNTGVVATDTTGVGTARWGLAAAGYGTDKAIFGYGYNAGAKSMTNLVSNNGVVATDTTGVGTARYNLAAAGYGSDKAIFGYGNNDSINVSMTNLVSNTGVVATDTTGVGTARFGLAAAGFSVSYAPTTSNFKVKKIYADPIIYVTQKAIFGYGLTSNYVSITNLVSNIGVVSTDTTGVGTQRAYLAAAGYGTDKAIFGYGENGGGFKSITNLVSNTGVVATDTTGVGTTRAQLAAVGYGRDKAIFGYGYNSSYVRVSITNLVSNVGVVATDTTGVGNARYALAAIRYGGGQAMFAYGQTDGNNNALSTINLVSDTGVVASDTTAADGSPRRACAGADYGGDKGILGFGLSGGSYMRSTNLVSNTGVIASDTANYYSSGNAQERSLLAASGYGGDKAIFGFGEVNSTRYSITNLVSNTGVVASNTANSNPTGRYGLAAAGFSLT